MLKTFSRLLLASSLLVVFASPALAQGRPAAIDKVEIRQQDAQRVRQVQDTVQQRRLETDQNRDQRRATRCERIEANAQQHLEKFQDLRQARRNRYRQILALLDTVILRAGEAGLDTTEIEEVQTQLQQKVDLFVEDFEQVVSAAQALRRYQCQEGETDTTTLSGIVTDLKEAIRTSQASAAEVKTYYQETVKPALRALKAQTAQ